MKFPVLPLQLRPNLSLRKHLWMAMKLLYVNTEQITFRRSGTLWTGFLWDEYITYSLSCTGGYRTQDIRALLAWMESRGRFSEDTNVIIDVGANIGTSSIPFTQETNCHVLAIEPVPENFTVLRQNVLQNGLEGRITSVQTAVSNSQEFVQMVVPKVNSGGAEVIRPGIGPSFSKVCGVKEIIEVRADTLDSIVNSHQIFPERVAFVWSDTQGCEGEVIESGSSLWLEGVPLYTELDPRVIRTQGGMDSFIDIAVKFFDRFIVSADLLIYGSVLKPHPISKLGTLCRSLSRQSAVDVLLLPKGC